MRVYLAESKKDGIASEFKELASQVATLLADHSFILVSKCLDGGMVFKSLMTYKYENGDIIGISDVNDAEIMGSYDIEDTKVTKNTFERTKEIFYVSDMIIILPGGIGTISELLAFLEEKISKNSHKRIILFNYNDYYHYLLKFLVDSHNEGFISDEALKMLSIINDINSLKNYLERMEK